MLFFPSNKIDAAWDKVKKGVQEGNLWHAKVSTRDNNKPTHAIMIYTRDYTDLKDVVSVLNYLETCGLKSAKTVSRYKTDTQTRAGIYSGGIERPWIYSSDTIHGKKITDELSMVRADQQQLQSNKNAMVGNTPFSNATSSTSDTVLNAAVLDSWEKLGSERAQRQTLSLKEKEPRLDDNTMSGTVLNAAVPDSWEELDSEGSKSQTSSQNGTDTKLDNNTFRSQLRK